MGESIKVSIAAARTNAGLTQPELAEILNVTTATVVNWEKGRSEPSAGQLKKISELSAIPMDNILLPLSGE